MAWCVCLVFALDPGGGKALAARLGWQDGNDDKDF
jgi:hypothetical protein